MKTLEDYRLYGNIVFLIPVLAGLYIHNWVFTTLSLMIFTASTAYHFSVIRNSKKINITRVLDIMMAGVSYSYLFYFITVHKEVSIQSNLYLLLAATLVVFIIGKRKDSELIHAMFHTSIAVAAWIIATI